MKTITKTIELYQFEELSKESQEKVIQWYMDDPFRSDIFTDMCNEFYNSEFPNSELEPHYSLSNCQGDGYNTEGKLLIYEIIDKLKFTDEEKKILHSYYDEMNNMFTFQSNRQYGYSCKFIDRKCIDEYVEDDVDNLIYYHFPNADSNLIKRMYGQIFDYFENLDKQFEEDGYKFFYEPNIEEIKECCDANDYWFTKDGKFYAE